MWQIDWLINWLLSVQDLCVIMTSKLETEIYYTKDWLTGGIAVVFTCCMKILLFWLLRSWISNMGQIWTSLHYSGCIQAVKKYIKSIDVQSNKALNMRKSLTIFFFKGTQMYFMLFENGNRPGCCNKWSMKMSKHVNWNATFSKIQKIQEVKLKWFQIRITHRILANKIYY